MTDGRVLGIHHVTAISGPAQENIDFYAGILGLRLVKLTVNFDDPSAYHLYYGDGVGNPGSIITFFPYPDGYPGRPGAGQATVTSLSIPANSMSFWIDRLAAHAVDFDRPSKRHHIESLAFRAPDGLLLELVAAHDHIPAVTWEDAPVSPTHAISGVRSVLLRERDPWVTTSVLTERLGFRQVDDKDGRLKFEIGSGGPSKIVEVAHDVDGPSARSGHGTIHHIAFRTTDDDVQLSLREELVGAGLHVSPVMDRDYFKSIYFREPGGVLFEIATDPPGFTVDEPLEVLGTSLQLPEKFELYRTKIERALPVLRLP